MAVPGRKHVEVDSKLDCTRLGDASIHDVGIEDTAIEGVETCDAEIYEKTTDEIKICAMCDSKPSAGHCLQCEMHTCHSCFDMHLKIKQCRDHEFQNVSGKSTVDIPVRFDICSKHARQEVKLYCADHKFAGCAECMLFAHRTCSYEYIVEVAKRFEESEELAQMHEDIQNLNTTLRECKDKVTSKIEATKMTMENVIVDIEAFTESVMTFAKEAKRHALNEATIKKSVNEKQINKLNNELRTIESQIEVIKTAFQNEELVHKLFLLSIESKPKIDSLRAALSAIASINTIKEYEFRPSLILKDMVLNTRPLGTFTDKRECQKGISALIP